MIQPSYQNVVADNQRLRGELAALREENAALRNRVTELESALEAAERKAKRQAAPFSKGKPKPQPRKPGRKPGESYGKKAHREPPPPEAIDEHHDVPLPD